MSLIEKFLKDNGLTDEQIQKLKLEEDERPEDFNYDDFVKKFREEQSAVYRKRLKSTIDSEISDRMTNLYKTLGRKISKQFEVEGIDESKISSKDDFDKILEALKSEIDEKISSVSDNDELLAKFEAQKSKAQELSQDLQSWKEKYEHDVKAAREEAEEKIRQIQVDKIFANEFSKIDWGVPDEHRDIFEDRIKREILENYKITEDGVLLDKEGHGKAVNFSGTGTYTNVDEPIKFLVNKYNLVKKSQGGQSESGGRPANSNRSGHGTTDTMSEHAKEMRERMLNASKRFNK